MARKPDYKPLLAPGYHRLTLEDFRRLCVDPYPESTNRRHLFLHLEQLIQDLLILKIPCQVRIDGSVLTEHPAPDDLDIAILLEHDVANNLSVEQRELIDRLNNSTYNYPRVDGFVFVRFSRGHPSFESNEIEIYAFTEYYNIENGLQWLKGVAVIVLGETDVGLRICS